jgi:hypothetical protein
MNDPALHMAEGRCLLVFAGGERRENISAENPV